MTIENTQELAELFNNYHTANDAIMAIVKSLITKCKTSQDIKQLYGELSRLNSTEDNQMREMPDSISIEIQMTVWKLREVKKA